MHKTALGAIALIGFIGGIALLAVGSAQQASFYGGTNAAGAFGFGAVLIVVGLVAGIAWLMVGAIRRD